MISNGAASACAKAESMPQPQAANYCDARGVQREYVGGPLASVVTQLEVEGRGFGETQANWMGFCCSLEVNSPLRRICGFGANAGDGTSYEAQLERKRTGAKL